MISVQPAALLTFLLMVAAAPVAAADVNPKDHGEPCPAEKRADSYPMWEYITNNARRTADAYAVKKKNPSATFILARAELFYQVDGDHKGKYLLALTSESGRSVVFAMLLPRFDMCSDPSALDDERKDLFRVVVAKLNGRRF